MERDRNLKRSFEDMNYVDKIFKRVKRFAFQGEPNFRQYIAGSSFPNQPSEVVKVEFTTLADAESHMTSKYVITKGPKSSPVLRRGFPFSIGIEFNRPLNMNNDTIILSLMFGPNPMVNNGTLIILPVTSSEAFTRGASNWDIRLQRIRGTLLTVQVHISHMAMVGMWEMKIKSTVVNTEAVKIYDAKSSIFVLFNPWNKADSVYMENKEAIEEYVLSDFGKIFLGIHQNPMPRPWSYGQVNGNDNKGVLMGNWSGNYSNGVEPWMWSGSADILKRYIENEGMPVGYGQCVDFSAVATTVCRALGIPCRPITNYLSGRGKDDNLNVDIFVNVDGYQQNRTKDMNWNYHCWTECWFIRPDLPPGFEGWQVIDGTPQKEPEGLSQCGPISVTAVLNNVTGIHYDTELLFSAVNSNILTYIEDSSAEYGYKVASVDKKTTGTLICTKQLGKQDYNGIGDLENITHLYKSKRVSEKEQPLIQDIEFQLRTIKKTMMGEDFTISMEFENNTKENKNVTVILTASTMLYIGTIAYRVKQGKKSFILKPKEKEELQVDVLAEDYNDKLVEGSMFRIYALCMTKETGQTSVRDFVFRLEKPVLKIEFEGSTKVEEELKIKISFENPLDRTLENCHIVVEGPRFIEPHRKKLGDVKPTGIMEYIGVVIPKNAGTRVVTAIFSSRQITGVMGSAEVVIKED